MLQALTDAYAQKTAGKVPKCDTVECQGLFYFSDQGPRLAKVMPRCKVVAAGLRLELGPPDPWHPCGPATPPGGDPEQNVLTA